MFKSIVEKNFDWLIKRGYCKKKASNKKYAIFYYEKDDIFIKIQLNCEYSLLIKDNKNIENKYISFHDYTFLNQVDRDDLKNIMTKFKSLHYIDQMEGYVVNTIIPHAAFLKKYISIMEGKGGMHNSFTINDAKIFFQEYNCNLLGVYRDEYQKYHNYYSLKITKETEEEWRKESINEKLNNLNNCDNSYRNITSIIKLVTESETEKHKNTETLLNWLNINIEMFSRLDLLIILESIIGSKRKMFTNGLIFVAQGNKTLQELILEYKNNAIKIIRDITLSCANDVVITDLRIENDINNFEIAQKHYGNKAININLIQSCEKLKENAIIKTKLIIDDSNQFIKIRFNEYLELTGDDSLLYLNGELNHFHFEDADDFIDFILNIANGETIFIENRNPFSLKRLKGIILQPWNLKMMNRNKFETRKWKYLSKKWLRVYTGNEIIKRDFIDYKKYDNPENKRNLTIKYMEKLNQMLLEDGFKERFHISDAIIFKESKCYDLIIVHPSDCTKVIKLCVLDYPDLSFFDNFYDDFDLALTDDFEMNIKRIYSLLKPILSNEIISVTGLYENRRFGGIYTKEQFKNRKLGNGYSNLKTNIWNGEVDEVN